MSIICPNFKNKEVKQQFDELVAATSEQAAYHIWSQNEGLPIDRTPVRGSVTVDIDPRIEDVANMMLNKLSIKTHPFRSAKKVKKAEVKSDIYFVTDYIGDLYYNITGLRLDVNTYSIEDTIETLKFELRNNLKQKLQVSMDEANKKVEEFDPINKYVAVEGVENFIKRKDAKAISEYSPQMQDIIKNALPFLFKENKFKTEAQAFAFAKHNLAAIKQKVEKKQAIQEQIAVGYRSKLKKAETLLTFTTMINDYAERIEKKILSEMRRMIEFKVYANKINEAKFNKGKDTPITKAHNAATFLTDNIKLTAGKEQHEKMYKLFPYRSIYLPKSDNVVAESNVRDVLKTIIGFNSEYSSLAKFLSNFVEKNNLRVELVAHMDQAAGRTTYTFDNSTGKTIVTSAVVLISLDSKEFTTNPERLLLHEIVHSLTSLRVVSDPELKSAIETYIKYCKDYVGQNSKVSRMFGFDMVYGFTNASEFISEFFTNGTFQNLLKEIPAMDQSKFLNMFDMIVRKIMQWLGIKSNNAYEQIKPVMNGILNLQQESLKLMTGLENFSVNQLSSAETAANGAPSKLFSDLLEHFNGDRVLAIQAKAKVFSKSFKEWFGDWQRYRSTYNITDASKKLITTLEEIINSADRYSELAKVLLESDAIPYNLKYFRIDNTREDIEGHEGMYNSLANLIEVLANNVSQTELNKALLHELIHYNTEGLLEAYRKDSSSLTEEQKNAIKNLYDIVAYTKDYILKNYKFIVSHIYPFFRDCEKKSVNKILL